MTNPQNGAPGQTGGSQDPTAKRELHPDSTTPQLDRERRTTPVHARYGLAGEILEQLEPHTEGHPWAILGQFLTMFGNALGRGPHVMVGADRHPCRLFSVICGPSSIARKGSSLGVVEKVFEYADQGWLYDRRKSGLASGEALIQQFADGEFDEDGETYVRQSDKRLMLVETEFARVLQVASRPGSIVSPVIRQAWDTGNLSNLTRKGAVETRHAHVSIIGHITDHELRRELTESDASNGFANRFLYLQVQRAKRVAILPSLEDDKAKRLGKMVGSALDKGRTLDRIMLSDRAVKLWDLMYAMEEDDPNPLLAVLVGRATAYMLRIATTYAVLDGHSRIELEHLIAAAEIWDYSAASVGRIFGNRTGSTTADRIADALADAGDGELTRTEISDLFQRHRSKDEIDEALDRLHRLDVIVHAKRHTDGPGRSAEVVRLSKRLDEANGVPGTLGRVGYLVPAVAATESILSLDSQFAVNGTDEQRPSTTAKEAKEDAHIDDFEDGRSASPPTANCERSETNEETPVVVCEVCSRPPEPCTCDLSCYDPDHDYADPDSYLQHDCDREEAIQKCRHRGPLLPHRGYPMHILCPPKGWRPDEVPA